MKSRWVLLLISAFVLVSLALDGSAAQAAPPNMHFAAPATVTACDANTITMSYTVVHEYTSPGTGLSIQSRGTIGGVVVYDEGALSPYATGAPTSYPWSFAFPFSTTQPNATYTYTHTWLSVQNGVVVYTSSLSGTCTWTGAASSPGAATISNVAGGSAFQGPPIPKGFVLLTITCNVAAVQSPGGPVVPNIKPLVPGATWYMSPTPVKDAKGKLWTEVFLGGWNNAFIPAECATW
jgi:hypothetical protein